MNVCFCGSFSIAFILLRWINISFFPLVPQLSILSSPALSSLFESCPAISSFYFSFHFFLSSSDCSDPLFLSHFLSSPLLPFFPPNSTFFSSTLYSYPPPSSLIHTFTLFFPFTLLLFFFLSPVLSFSLFFCLHLLSPDLIVYFTPIHLYLILFCPHITSPFILFFLLSSPLSSAPIFLLLFASHLLFSFPLLFLALKILLSSLFIFLFPSSPFSCMPFYSSIPIFSFFSFFLFVF